MKSFAILFLSFLSKFKKIATAFMYFYFFLSVVLIIALS